MIIKTLTGSYQKIKPQYSVNTTNYLMTQIEKVCSDEGKVYESGPASEPYKVYRVCKNEKKTCCMKQVGMMEFKICNKRDKVSCMFGSKCCLSTHQLAWSLIFLPFYDYSDECTKHSFDRHKLLHSTETQIKVSVCQSGVVGARGIS